MKALVVSLLSVVFFFPLTAVSETYEEAYFRALKSKTPNELAYYVYVDDDCPFDEKSVESIIDGVFIRSRIKPLKDEIFNEGKVYLNASIDCLNRENRNPIWDIDINFAKWRPFPAIKFSRGYGNYGVGDRDFILQTLQRGVEKAVTDHIKANFDL